MSNDTTTHAGRHIDFDAVQDFDGEEFELDEFERVTTTEPVNAYGPAWRARFATHEHLHNSIAS